MTDFSSSENKAFGMARLFTINILVAAPILFLFISRFYNQPVFESENLNLITIVSLAFSAFAPLLIPVVRRAIVNARNVMKEKGRSPENAVLTSFIVFSSIIELSYILGLVNFFLSNELQRLLYFYPIGIFWTIKYWPTAERFEQRLNELKAP